MGIKDGKYNKMVLILVEKYTKIVKYCRKLLGVINFGIRITLNVKRSDSIEYAKNT